MIRTHNAMQQEQPATMSTTSDHEPAPASAPDVESGILELARTEPELGQVAVADRLRSAGMRISASGVRYIWQKHGLETTVKRLQALAGDTERDGPPLTTHQRQLLERGKLSARLARRDPTGKAGKNEEPLERRGIILDAAAELFAELGYDRASIRDIAAKAGLLAGSVYHYFRSKEELYVAVHREGFEIVLQRVRTAADAGNDPWDKLRRACEIHVSGIVEGTAIDRITVRNLAVPENHELLERTRPYREAYEQVFRDLINALPLAPGTDRTLMRLFLLGGMNWIYLWYRKGRRTPREISDAMVDMIRDGVAAS